MYSSAPDNVMYLPNTLHCFAEFVLCPCRLYHDIW